MPPVVSPRLKSSLVPVPTSTETNFEPNDYKKGSIDYDDLANCGVRQPAAARRQDGL